MRSFLERKTRLSDAVVGQGYGLHTGELCSVRVLPCDPGSGWVLSAAGRSDRVLLSPDLVSDTKLCTRLTLSSGRTVSTIEHLLAALCLLEVADVHLEFDGPEVPAMDGSAGPWIDLIEPWLQPATPTVSTRVPSALLGRSISCARGDSFARFTFAERWHLSVAIDFPDIPCIGYQTASWKAGDGLGVARARTFARLEEVEHLRLQGLALGGTLDNAIVIHAGRVMNPEGLRFANEFARHKLLDCIGDLALLRSLPFEVRGTYVAHRPSHALNAEMAGLIARAVDVHRAPATAA